jgi:hypothetical protein
MLHSVMLYFIKDDSDLLPSVLEMDLRQMFLSAACWQIPMTWWTPTRLHVDRVISIFHLRTIKQTGAYMLVHDDIDPVLIKV